MKKSIFCLFILTMTIYSCDDNESGLINLEENESTSKEIEYLKSLGFKESNIEYDEINEMYILEGDIVIHKENLFSCKPLLQINQNKNAPESNESHLKSYFNPNNSVVSDANIIDVKIAISTQKVPTEEWTSQLTEAIRMWNDIPGCKINIRQVPEGSHDIIMQGSTTTSHQAYSSYPSGGNPCSFIVFRNTLGANANTPSKRAEIIAHEIGHAIGFAHNWDVNPWDPNDINTNHIPGTTVSYNYNSIMSQPDHGEYGICKDDIMGANAYYSLDDHTLTAVVSTSSWGPYAYFFNGSEYTHYNKNENVAYKGYPRTISSGWQGSFSSNIDAAIDWDANYIFLFKGSEFVRFNKNLNRVDYGPQPIDNGWWNGVFTYDIDAAVNWDNNYAFFFKGTQFVRFNKNLDRVDYGPVNISSPGQWDGIPNYIDAAMNYGNGYIYFFKGDMFYGFNIAANKCDSGYPRSIDYIQWPGIAF